MSIDPALERFAGEVTRGEEADLGRAALLLGLYADPAIDVEAYVARLDALAAAAGERRLAPVATIASLFGEGGLAGNDQDYYQPENSLLNHVLDRALGIPISLSVVAIEVGRRLGIAVEGVPFPGHFLVRVRPDRGQVLLDPFAGGAEVGDEDLLLRLHRVTGRIASLGPDQLGGASKQLILTRMLNNLKAIYLRQDDIQSAFAVQQRLVVLRPDEVEERRDRGLLLARLGFSDQAEDDLRAYLALTPGAADAATVRQVVDHLGKRRQPRN